MKIKDIELYRLSVPLKRPFKTALRTVDAAEALIVKVLTDTEHSGYGEAPPTAVIAGIRCGSGGTLYQAEAGGDGRF